MGIRSTITKAGFRFALKDVDRGWDALLKAMKAAKAAQDGVKAGVLAGGTPRDDGALTNADIAIIHEFGSPEAGIPERPFVRPTFEAHRAEYISTLRTLVKGIYQGKVTTDKALGIIGARMAADMKKRIQDGVPPPNAPSTIARKGSSKPLIDTGQLINSITWVLEKRSGHGSH